MKGKARFCAVLCAVMAGVMAVGGGYAYALKITATRVVFDGPVRNEVLTVVNDGPRQQTFRIDWQDMSMNADGRLEVLDPAMVSSSAVRPARGMVVFSPRRVSIPAGGSQQIRLMLRRSADMTDGEYRSHLVIRPEKETIPFGTDPSESPDAMRARITIDTSMTFPVIVRHGKTAAEGTITDIALERKGRDGHQMRFVLTRTGSRSLYGDIEVFCVAGGQKTSIHRLRGLAVYAETDRRAVVLPLSFETETGAKASCDVMRIEYVADAKDIQFRGRIIAGADFLPPANAFP